MTAVKNQSYAKRQRTRATRTFSHHLSVLRHLPCHIPLSSFRPDPRFGDVAHAPPNLAKIPKPRGFKDQGQAKPWARQQKNQNNNTHKKGKADTGTGGGGAAGNSQEGGDDGDGGGEAAKAQRRQMEEMRQRVLEAYSGMKKKRRAGQTQFVGSDL